MATQLTPVASQATRELARADVPAAVRDGISGPATGACRGDAEYLARHRLMLADLGLAANRLAQIEAKGLRPRARVTAMTAQGREDFLAAMGGPADAGRLHHIEKFKLKPLPCAHAAHAATPVLAPALWQARGLKELGLVLPPRDVPHTMDVAKYVANRLPRVALDKIAAFGVEIFFGTAPELQAWCVQSGWVACAEFGAPSSSKFVYLQRGSKEKMLITGIMSRARLVHQVLQLHFAGIDTAAIQLRGDLEALQAATLGRLAQRLDELPDVPDKVCFFGARRLVAPNIRRLLEDRPVPGVRLSSATACVVDSLAFDHMTLELPDRRVLLLAFRMPNGDLAQGCVEALLNHGVGTLVMCGAGGALDARARIGDYCEIGAAYRAGECLQSPPEVLLPAPESANTRRNTVNITVDSPLEETAAWFSQAAARADCVDVESAHIFRGFHAYRAAHPDSGARLVAGLFVSDVVGHQPLEEKISSADAYADLGPFIGAVLTGLGLLPGDAGTARESGPEHAQGMKRQR